LALASELGMRPLVAHCHLGLGKLYRRTDKREQAREHRATATTMYREIGITYWLEKAEAETGESTPEESAEAGPTGISDGRPALSCRVVSLLTLTGEELLDIRSAELGAFDDRMADARKHLLEPRADLTLADLVGAPFDPFGRHVHLALVSSVGRAPG
jgi:hypothetical protein